MVFNDILTGSTGFTGPCTVYDILNLFLCSWEILEKLKIHWSTWSLYWFSMKSLLDLLVSLVPVAFMTFWICSYDLYKCMCIIYIEREWYIYREIYTYIHMCYICMYIYTYIYIHMYLFSFYMNFYVFSRCYRFLNDFEGFVGVYTYVNEC